MGKRKAKRKPMQKKKLVLDTQFNCIFCNHEKSVDVKMYGNREDKVGNLACRACGAKFQSIINQLSDPVDVYSDWVDAAEMVKPEGDGGHGDYDDDQLDDEGLFHSRVAVNVRSPDYGEDDEDDLE
ncbi:11953_t:CDS:2 [Acaulospora morrowiae]|uniref:Transcription elongation factor 1 homolog n=1 Tax=Acaulospora morrowiae TaxID=94023 RepID=A0A9N8Z7P2_9GLOM|nr:11953_t:CDS:2 [Acaulospora morrowiae]